LATYLLQRQRSTLQSQIQRSATRMFLGTQIVRLGKMLLAVGQAVSRRVMPLVSVLLYARSQQEDQEGQKETNQQQEQQHKQPQQQQQQQQRQQKQQLEPGIYFHETVHPFALPTVETACPGVLRSGMAGIDLLEIIAASTQKAASIRKVQPSVPAIHPAHQPIPAEPPHPSATEATAATGEAAQAAAAERAAPAQQEATKAGRLLYSPLSYRPTMIATWQASISVKYLYLQKCTESKQQ
jgi:hypothetical protein